MKLLFDQNISFRTVKALRGAFPNCKHVSDCGLMDTEDSEIWKFAKEKDYSIVTFDSDFYDISLINGHPPKIIWIRTGNLTKNQIVELLVEQQYSIRDFLESSKFKFVSCLEIE